MKLWGKVSTRYGEAGGPNAEPSGAAILSWPRKELKLVGEPEKGARRKAQEWKPRAASDEAALGPEGRAPVLYMPWENEHYERGRLREWSPSGPPPAAPPARRPS